MAKLRAYKLAEELGIDRHEFVSRAAEAGVEVRSAMSGLDESEVETLREKLGQPTRAKRQMVESRVEGSGGATVLRRRKKAKAEPVPEPVVEEAPAEEADPVPAEEVALESPEIEDAIAAAEEAAADEAVEPEAAPEESPEAEVATPQVQAEGQAGEGAAATASTRSEPATPATPASQDDRKGRKRKRVREIVNLQEQEKFARQITSRGQTPRRSADAQSRPAVSPRRKRRDKLSPRPAAAAAAEQTKAIKVAGEVTVGELAKLIGVKAPVVQGKLMALGIMVSINQRVDIETCRKLAQEYDIEVQDVGFKEEEFLDISPLPASGDEGAEGDSASVVQRAPVITVMGHVDHGKTSLLDAIRDTRLKVVDQEAGGITQHIGAYQVKSRDRTLSFIDTPGHAAFTAMRARGAAVTDIVVLVVAANDGVMPQTIEAIEHAQAADCPIVVAINKIDLPEADSEKAKQRLTEHNLVPEDFGGDVICVDVSAKTGEGIPNLLEMLALQTELLELKADPTRRASGFVLEANLDKGRGPMATLLVLDGTLKKGDVLVAGSQSGRTRVMEDDQGRRLTEAGPSTPVQVQGLSGVPAAGQEFHVVESDRIAKQITSHREERERGEVVAAPARLTLEEFFARADGTMTKELPLVLKADVQGTSEAVRDSLEKLSTDEVKVKVLSAGVGAITESDVMLASASEAIVIGFHVRPYPEARAAADRQGVDVRSYTIIMDLIDEVKGAMSGLLPPLRRETMLGRAEVKQIFTIPRMGTIAGSMVVEGKVQRNAHCRLVRDGVQVYEGEVESLRRFKDDVREVSNGSECGIGISNFNDVKPGDEIEVFEVEEVPATI